MNNHWITEVDPRLNRYDQLITDINNQKDLTTCKLFQRKRKAFIINGNNIERLLPAINFRTGTVLIIYLRNRSERPGYDSFIVDKNGDLTFQAPPVAKLGIVI